MNAVAEQYALEVDMNNEVLARPLPFRLDWFEGTTRAVDVDHVKKVIGGEWVPTRPTANNYERAETNGAITVMWAPMRDHRAKVNPKDGLTEMGVFVRIPGSADPSKHYPKIINLQIVPSRFDLAFDTDEFDVAYVLKAYEEKRIQTIIRTPAEGNKLTLDEEIAGVPHSSLSWYGARTRVVVYDKAKEQGLEGVTWTRIEYRFLDKRAKEVWADMSNALSHCHKAWRIMKRKYACMTQGKLDNKFARCVVWDNEVADNLYSKLIIMSPSQVLAQSKAAARRLLSWIKTHLCADPQLVAELVNTSVKQDLLSRLLYEAKRLRPDVHDSVSSFAHAMQKGALAHSLSP